jgi:hypothetical protein
MATDWKHTLERIATTLGKGLWLLARWLYALLVMLGRFVFLRAIPATWRWLRGTALPALRRFYLWLPHRRIVAGCAVGVVAVAAGVLVVGLPWSDSGSRGAHDAPIRIPSHEARLVEALLSDDWQQQKAATRSVLESVGVSVLADDAPLPGDGGVYVIAPELVMLAMDGARKGSSSRLRLAEVAMMLDDLGYPFPEGRHPAVSMRDSIQAWVAKSLEDPKAPGAAAARFLHAMAAQQRPALDLSSPDWPAEQYALTHLELFVLDTAMAQLFAGGAPAPSTASRPDPLGGLLDLGLPPAHAAGPAPACAVTKDLYNSPDAYDANKKNMENVFGFGGGQAEAAGGAAAAAAKAASALSTLFKLHKLMLLYSSLDMRVTADQSFVHKPAKDEAGKEVVFRTTVGIEEEKYREFVEKMNASPVGKAVKECLASMGLPTPTDLGDIVKEMKNWEVSWDLYGDHATWGQAKNRFKSGNQRREPLEPVSETHAGADFIVDIKSEDHHDGDIVTGYIHGQATLHTDAMPGSDALASYQAALDTLKDGNALAALLGATGTTVGLTGSLLGEVLGGWAQRILDPEVSYNVAVAYHKHRYPGYSYEGTVEAQTEFSESRTERKKGKRNPRGRLGIGGEDSTYTYRVQHRGQLTVQDMRPTYMAYTRYTERQDTAKWEMSGEGNFSGAFSLFQMTEGQRGCAGVKAPEYYFNDLHMGSDSTSSPRTYSMSIEQVGSRDEGYRIQLRFRDDGGSILYEARTSTHHGAGCEFAAPDGFTGDNSFWNSTGIRLTGTGYEYAVSEPYPETISGTATVGDEGGAKTTWKWNFRRVGPIKDPTAEAGKVGGG